jgi:hypothetical protein
MLGLAANTVFSAFALFFSRLPSKGPTPVMRGHEVLAQLTDKTDKKLKEKEVLLIYSNGVKNKVGLTQGI